MLRIVLLTAGLVGALPGTSRADEPVPASLAVAPAEFVLQGLRSRQPLLVTGNFGESEADFTATAKYESSNPEVAVVDARGRVTPKGDGSAEIVVRHAGREARAQVSVSGEIGRAHV